MSVQVTVDTTPNEHALKFSVNKQILDSGYKTFNSLEDAKDFPVAAKIFANEAVASVFVMAQPSSAFITVTKKPETSWADLQNKIVEGIKISL
jgi:NFU1 iron-sulfur cluster scaffold homolog, mitochondrial